VWSLFASHKVGSEYTLDEVLRRLARDEASYSLLLDSVCKVFPPPPFFFFFFWWIACAHAHGIEGLQGSDTTKAPRSSKMYRVYMPFSIAIYVCSAGASVFPCPSLCRLTGAGIHLIFGEFDTLRQLSSTMAKRLSSVRSSRDLVHELKKQVRCCNSVSGYSFRR
jgi:hypothetical protein